MPIFYLSFRVAPTPNNPHVNVVRGAVASCWVNEDSAQAAFAKARFYVRRYEWEIHAVDSPPMQVTRDDFAGRDIGLQQYSQANETGVAMVFVAWAADGKSRFGPVKLEGVDDFAIEMYLRQRRTLRQKGRCLHYEADRRCSRAIYAHSIQKNGALSRIADLGHVYAVSSNFDDVKRHRGAPSYTKQGIHRVSTFRGFCREHDELLFRPIDTAPLIPTGRQALLYAYRALCREAFVKENALLLLETQAGLCDRQAAVGELFEGMRLGTAFGLNNLLRHKALYEQSLSSGSYSDIKFVAFCSRHKPTLAFSGLVYPDFDFLGRQLQDLDDQGRQLDLLSFSFAPMENGWGVLFAWHSDSSTTCIPFMKSLATRVHDDENALGDHIFRLVVSCCENVAIAPEWWEGLPAHARLAIEKALSRSADIFTLMEPDYLAQGLEGLSGWNFDNVVSDMV